MDIKKHIKDHVIDLYVDAHTNTAPGGNPTYFGMINILLEKELDIMVGQGNIHSGKFVWLTEDILQVQFRKNKVSDIITTMDINLVEECRDIKLNRILNK